jgi:hypothetical protein
VPGLDGPVVDAATGTQRPFQSTDLSKLFVLEDVGT